MNDVLTGLRNGAGGTRTHDLRFRKPSLYPPELQPPEIYYALRHDGVESRGGDRN